MTPSRLTASERRDEIVAAASIEFAARGYAGTSTEDIARRAGVSQPYLFALFGTKKRLFIEVVGDCFERTDRAFREAAAKARSSGITDPEAILKDMGNAYINLLLANRDVLRLQLQGYAACQDPDVRQAVRAAYEGLFQSVASLSGADPQFVHSWFAEGMLINVVATIGEEDHFYELLYRLGGVHDYE